MAEGGEGGSGVSGAEVIGAAGGVAGLIPSLFGRGQNTRIAPGFYGQPGYDKNASYYGGSKGGLATYTAQQQANANAADSRGANLANYDRANIWEQGQAQARQGQTQLAQAQMQRALGQTPSIAQMQADREMKQAQAAQGAQQASARGAAGLALAGQVAAGNTANAQSAISGQAQINAANERMQAEGAAQQAYGNIRAGDVGAQGQAAQQAQFQAGMQQANRDANDNRAMGYAQLGAHANDSALAARTQNQGTLAGAYNAANVANQQTGNQNAGSKGIISTLSDFFSSDERAKLPVLLPGMGGQRRPDEAMPMMGAGSGAAPTSYEVLNGSGGENVGASGQAMSDFATKYVHNPGASPAMYSDERTKMPLLARGINPRGIAAPPPVAPTMAFDPVHGWHLAGEPPPAPDAPTDDGGADIDRQVAERRALDKREAKDPAVGLERVGHDRGMIRGGRIPSDDNARTDEEKGLAPGTTDFEATKDKADPGPGQRPWWTAIGGAAKSLNEAQFGNRPTMVSDERAKRAVYIQGRQDGLQQARSGETVGYPGGMAPLNTDDEEFVVGKDGRPEIRPTLAGTSKELDRGVKAAVTARDTGSMFDRDAQYLPTAGAAASGRGAQGSMDRDAQYLDSITQAASRGAARGADPVAGANRAMAGAAYAYKPGMTPPEQEPGEPNFGPMAQNMEKNPITATAVKTDPSTGLKVLDKDKMLKVTASGVADLQQQQDETNQKLALLAGANRSTKLAFGGRR